MTEFRHGKEECREEMIRKQNLVGNVSFVCSPTIVVHLALNLPTLSISSMSAGDIGGERC